MLSQTASNQLFSIDLMHSSIRYLLGEAIWLEMLNYNLEMPMTLIDQIGRAHV